MLKLNSSDFWPEADQEKKNPLPVPKIERNVPKSGTNVPTFETNETPGTDLDDPDLNQTEREAMERSVNLTEGMEQLIVRKGELARSRDAMSSSIANRVRRGDGSGELGALYGEIQNLTNKIVKINQQLRTLEKTGDIEAEVIPPVSRDLAKCSMVKLLELKRKNESNRSKKKKALEKQHRTERRAKYQEEHDFLVLEYKDIQAAIKRLKIQNDA
jgi:hypothetical protein